MLLRICTLCLLTMVAVPAAELKLGNGSIVAYEKMDVTIEAPMTFLTLTNADGIKAYRYSEIDLKALPAKDQADVAAYVAKKLRERMIIKNDKWIHRDEMLLNADPRYAAPAGKLVKFGPSLIEFKNTTDHMVTIGVRANDKGWEMHLEAGKKKGYEVPNGKVFYIMAQESEDGTQLVVQKSAPVDMQKVHLEVTILSSSEIPPGEMGTIDIPAQYQVH